jgi:hypothetical protein
MLDSAFTITLLVGGTVLGFQFVMMLLGLGHHGHDFAGHHGDVGGADGFDGSVDGDASFDGDASVSHDSGWGGHSTDGDIAQHDVSSSHSGLDWFYEIISIRTLAAAGTFFGLVGKTMLAYGHSPLASFVYAALAGGGAMYCVYWLFKQVYRLENSGNENVRRAIGLPATVYVPIPGARAGAGKVTFRLQDRTVEYLAVTNESNRLATGEKVTIVGIVNAGTVRVARERKEAPVETPA